MNRNIKVNYVPIDKVEDYNFGNIESEYTATKYYFLRNNETFLPIMGEFHFSRCEAKDWERELLKMKASGVDGVCIYVFWNHHENVKGKFDFSGQRNIAAMLQLCRDTDMKVVLRIGPWCHGEARYGGFPNWLRFVPGKRRSTPYYLSCVRKYWTRLHQEINEYLDGKTVIGIQLENEYGGPLSHIVTLREIAEEIGLKTPFFTMTAWPTNTPDRRFLPLMGGYPEAPWTQNKRPLTPKYRFAITAGRTEQEIGEDLIKNAKPKADFSDFPYSGCEVGTGNQVTQHRRPIISDKDGYGVAFAKFASGMNWMGYYMYHGGRNPRGEMLQESRRTLYPNNYPIIDYDFQSPFSKDGDLRLHGSRLRLLHLFIKNWDNNIAKKQAFFTQRVELPYMSVRSDGNEGYCFISNYERGSKTTKTDINISIEQPGGIINHNITVPENAMFFYPYNIDLMGLKFDYIHAQPLFKKKTANGLECYFMIANGVTPNLSIMGNRIVANNRLDYQTSSGELSLIFLKEDDALNTYYIDGKIVKTNGMAYSKNNIIHAEISYGGFLIIDDKSIKIPSKIAPKLAVINEIPPVKLPHNHYLFSAGKRAFYSLEIDVKQLSIYDDVILTLDFKGLNLQLFSGKILLDDYFNTDGKFLIHLNHWKEFLQKDNKLIIKASAPTAHGIGSVYNEINMEIGKINLSISDVTPIFHAVE